MAESEPKKEGGGGGGGGGSKLLMGLLALNSLITVGVLVVVLLRTGAPKHPPAAAGGEAAAGAKAEGHGDPKGEKAADKANLPGPIVKFPDFVVHLRDPEVDRYARLTIEVEVQDEKVREALTLRLPAIRDSFIAYLSDRSTADLRGSEAISRAKVELLERLKVSAPGLGLRGLYVTELVVQ
jgi:flagellar FliL protein